MQVRRLAQRATKNDNTAVNFRPINGEKNSRKLNSPTVSKVTLNHFEPEYILTIRYDRMRLWTIKRLIRLTKVKAISH